MGAVLGQRLNKKPTTICYESNTSSKLRIITRFGERASSSGLLTKRFMRLLKHKNIGQTKFIIPTQNNKDTIYSIIYSVKIGSIHREHGLTSIVELTWSNLGLIRVFKK